MILFLDADWVMQMHGVLLEQWGGEEGGGHRGAEYEGVDAAVQAVKNSYYESIDELAAAYAVYIVQGHIFMDGNKRTGAAALETFLTSNGYTPTIGNAAMARLMVELQERAEAGEDPGRLVRWIAETINVAAL